MSALNKAIQVAILLVLIVAIYTSSNISGWVVGNGVGCIDAGYHIDSVSFDRDSGEVLVRITNAGRDIHGLGAVVDNELSLAPGSERITVSPEATKDYPLGTGHSAYIRIDLSGLDMEPGLVRITNMPCGGISAEAMVP
jgi:hypothetical protein